MPETDLGRVACFAINVTGNTARRDHMTAQADSAGLPIRFFPAVTPEAMDIAACGYDDKRARRFTGRSLLPGEIACGQSHMALWRQLQSDPDCDYYLILEDDIHIRASLADAVAKADPEGRDIGFLKLSGQVERPHRTVQGFDDGSRLVRYAYGPLDAAAYLIGREAAARLCDYCRPLFAPIDIMMDRAYDHGVPVYGIVPYPAATRFCFDPADPLYTDVGVRDRKYADDISWREKACVKWLRAYGGLKRKGAAFRLRMRTEG